MTDVSLATKSALVTGGSKGIGLAIVKALAARGCAIHVVARTAQTLENARRDIWQMFRLEIVTHELDLAAPEAWTELGNSCPDLDILVNNAGLIPALPLDRFDHEALTSSYATKLFGYVGLCREFYYRMRARRFGVIVNILGNTGQRPVASHISTGMANAALQALTIALGAEGPDYGVRVVGVSPGGVATERAIDAFRALSSAALADPERWPELATSMPFGRLARPDEIGEIVAFLCSEAASYVSGTVVTVDGGASARHRAIP